METSEYNDLIYPKETDMQTMTRQMMTVVVAMLVALMALPVSAQTTDEFETAGYMHPGKQQGILVMIADLSEEEALEGMQSMGYETMFAMIANDAFVEENMGGFIVDDSEELTETQLENIGADAGKLFGVREQGDPNVNLLLLLLDGTDLLMLAFLGFSTDAEFEAAVAYTADVLDEGIDADPPAGFIPYDEAFE